MSNGASCGYNGRWAFVNLTTGRGRGHGTATRKSSGSSSAAAGSEPTSSPSGCGSTAGRSPTRSAPRTGSSSAARRSSTPGSTPPAAARRASSARSRDRTAPLGRPPSGAGPGDPLQHRRVDSPTGSRSRASTRSSSTAAPSTPVRIEVIDGEVRILEAEPELFEDRDGSRFPLRARGHGRRARREAPVGDNRAASVYLGPGRLGEGARTPA